MMFYLYVQQNQWIVTTLLTGLALLLVFCLLYADMWRSRERERGVANEIRITGPLTLIRWIVSFTPWPVLIVIIVSIVYAIIHIAAAASGPPNW